MLAFVKLFIISMLVFVKLLITGTVAFDKLFITGTVAFVKLFITGTVAFVKLLITGTLAFVKLFIIGTLAFVKLFITGTLAFVKLFITGTLALKTIGYWHAGFCKRLAVHYKLGPKIEMTVSFFSAHQTPPRWDTASIADTVLQGRNTKSEDGRRDERLHLPFLAHTLILPEKQLHLKHHMCRQSSYDEKEKEKRLRDVGTQWKMGIISHSWVDGYN